MNQIDMPASLESERAVLGCMLLYSEAAIEVLEKVTPEHFSITSNQRIFTVMAEMLETGQPVDLITLAESLRMRSELSQVGGVAYLSSLTESAALRATVGHHATILKGKAILRGVIREAERAIERAYALEPAKEVLADMEEGLLRLRCGESATMVSLKDAMMPVLNEIAAAWKWEGDVIGCTSALPSIDTSTTGIRLKETWVIGARPGRGKTAWATQIMLANAQRGVPVAVFSLEMSQGALIRRLLVQEGLCSAHGMRNPKDMSEIQQSGFVSLAWDIAELPIYIDETAALHIRQLIARAKLAKRRFGIQLFIVDFLQLVEAPGKDERLRVSNAIRSLRDMAKTENIALIVLSQLRRSASENDVPSLGQLKESGSIEESADTVIFIYRPLVNNQFSGEDELIIAKQRNGPVGTEKVYFNSAKQRFVERA